MKYLIYNRSVKDRGFVKHVFVSEYGTRVEFSIKQNDAIKFDNKDNAMILAEYLKRSNALMDYSLWEEKE